MGQDLSKHTKVSGSYDSLQINKLNSLQYNKTTSKFTEREFKSLVKLFYNLAALSPQHNYISKTTFEHYFPLGGILAKRLFVAFDTDKNGLIDLQEFLDGMALCLQGSIDEKYKIAFEMFDLDGSNGVSPWELHAVLKSVLGTTSRLIEQRHNRHELTEVDLDYLAHRIVQDAFKQQAADLNGEFHCALMTEYEFLAQDNKMTLKVFKSWMEKHPFVLDSIFGQACLKDKNLQYSRFGNEERLGVPAENGLSSVKKQTWVDCASEDEISAKTSENTWLPIEEQGDNRPSYLQEHTMLPYKGPVNRRGHTAVISGDVMYVFGGYIDLRGASRELWKYEFSTNTWTREKSQSREWPSPRYSHSAAVFDKSMVIFGGLEEMQCKNDMWLWNMASCKWNKIKGKNSPPALFGHSAAKVGDGMLVFGGESTDGTLFNTLWRFNFDARAWSTVTPKGMISPPARSYHSLVRIPNFLFTSRRPTSSHSAPPCTPGYDRELPRLEEENETSDVRNPARLSSVVSMGSLDSTALLSQNEDEVMKIKLNPLGSLDSLITNKVLRETENMSMTNHERTCFSEETLVNISAVESNQHKIAAKPAAKPAANSIGRLQPTSGSQRVAALRLQLKPQSSHCLSPLSKVPFRGHPVSYPDDVLRSAVVNLMVLGGTSKRGIESVDRWIDMWKCQIDP
ncbi:hypothetical protein QZH41_014129, partial [Actinostola sp. cb2023]